MKSNPSLGDLQLAIMRVLWDLRKATASDVHGALSAERGLAPTTIATMLTKMEKKGVVSHYVDGRRFVYQPLVTEAQVRRSMVEGLRDRLFGGDVTAFVSHLLSEHEIDAQELVELKKLVSSREQKKKGKS
jgi:BlaI family penicillinase repressor